MNARTLFILLALSALLMGACGTSDQAATDESEDEAMPGMDDHDAMNGGEFAFALGEPADAADADRTITVEARDDMTFAPATIEVAVGEVVTFEVTNVGEAAHEFILGDRAYQDEHAMEMAEMDGHMAHDAPHQVTLAPGASGTLTWRFTRAGEVLYGCHEPGHYQAGMVGTITVTD